MKKHIELKTLENTTVHLNKDQIAAIEEIPATSRSPGYLKLYVAGYSFSVNMKLEELLKLIEDSK